MSLMLRFETANASFADAGRGEVARILRDVAQMVETGFSHGNLKDQYGNRVGSFRLTMPEALEEDEEDES
jgi:hypothetical protein